MHLLFHMHTIWPSSVSYRQQKLKWIGIARNTNRDREAISFRMGKAYIQVGQRLLMSNYKK